MRYLTQAKQHAFAVTILLLSQVKTGRQSSMQLQWTIPLFTQGIGGSLSCLAVHYDLGSLLVLLALSGQSFPLPCFPLIVHSPWRGLEAKQRSLVSLPFRSGRCWLRQGQRLRLERCAQERARAFCGFLKTVVLDEADLSTEDPPPKEEAEVTPPSPAIAVDTLPTTDQPAATSTSQIHLQPLTLQCLKPTTPPHLQQLTLQCHKHRHICA